MTTRNIDISSDVAGPLIKYQRPRKRFSVLGDSIFRWITGLFAAGVLVALGLMLATTTHTAWPVLDHHGWTAVTSTDWLPSSNQFGMVAFMYGTIVTALLALLIAVPVSVGAALFLTELAPPRVRTVVGALIDLLAAVPSVVYGLWAVLVLVPALGNHVWQPLSDGLGAVPLFGGPISGRSYATAGLVLAVMSVPIITAIVREVVLAVPIANREAALGIGATRWEVVRLAVLPHARAGIIGAVMLGFGRAVGETIAVALVIGGSATVHASLLQPGYTMASVIANEFPEATGSHINALVGIGVVLFAMTLIVNILARLLVRRSVKRLT